MKTEFDWHAYLYLHPDLLAAGIQTQYHAEQHYILFGQHEPRIFPRRLPSKQALHEAKEKLKGYISLLQQQHVHLTQRTMVIYHVDFPKYQQSIDIIYNNLVLFLRAVQSDSEQEVPKAFYWINVIGGITNPLYTHIHTYLYPSPSHTHTHTHSHTHNYTNIVLVDWNVSPHYMFTHLKTLSLLPRTLTQHFHMVVLTTCHARGPLGERKRGEWINAFLKVFLQNPEVGMMGPLLSCEKIPHIQPFMIAMKTELTPKIVSFYQKSVIFSSYVGWRRHFEEQISSFAREKLGVSLASLLYGYLNKDAGIFHNCIRFGELPKHNHRTCRVYIYRILDHYFKAVFFQCFHDTC
ncbi:hypothetical protein EON63_24605, partial [archaeon]